MKKLIVCCLLALVGFQCLAGGEADDVTLKTLTNKKVVFGEVANDEFVVLLFWSTTCKPCMNELSALMEIKEKWEGKFRILAISVDDARSQAKVKSVVNGNKWEFEVLLDVNKGLYNVFKLTSIPSTIMLNPEGKVVYRHVGYVPNDENILVETALKEMEKENK